MTKHQVSCTVAGCAICGDHPMEMDITYADTSPPCPSCAALRARIEDVEKLRIVIKHDAWMITSHDDPFILYQQGNMSKGKLCEYIASAIISYLKEAP